MRLDDSLTYEVDDRPPVAVSLGVGLQGVVLGLALTVMCVTFISDTGYVPRGWILWAVFAALIVNGMVGAVQASRFGARGDAHLWRRADFPRRFGDRAGARRSRAARVSRRDVGAVPVRHRRVAANAAPHRHSGRCGHHDHADLGRCVFRSPWRAWATYPPERRRLPGGWGALPRWP